MITKSPPHNIEIESAILAIYLAFPETQKKLHEVLIPEKFYSTKHALIYKNINTYKDLLKSMDTPVDAVAFFG